MYRERMVFRAKPGKVRELVNIFKDFNEAVPDGFRRNARILTDVTGESWTLILERDIESLDEIVTANPPSGIPEMLLRRFDKYHDFVEYGRREIYKYEE